MDGSSAPPPCPTRTTGGASKFLANLPSTGLFSSTIIPTNMGRMRVYITDRETAPPENQLIKTDQMNILIRSLVLKQQKGESSSKNAKGASDAGRKRAAEKSLDSRASTKRAVSTAQSGSRQEVSKSRLPENLHSLTVERLRALLKERNHSTKGKKEELIARLRASSSS